MTCYALGVDAGGSFTRYVVYGNQDVIEEYIGPTIHFMSVGFEGIRPGIEDAVRHFSNDYTFRKVMFGLAGYGEDWKLRTQIGKAVQTVFPDAVLVNDAQLAHIAALKNQDGIFVISGTGSIGIRKHQEQITRTGGFGYLLDDAGSGFWIGKQLLKRFTEEVDGRSIRTSIYKTLMDALNLHSGYEIIQKASGSDNYRHFAAEISGLFKDSKDDTVVQIFKEAGVQCAHYANALLKADDGEVLCSCGGSVLVNNSHVRASFIAALDPRLKFLYEPHRATDAVLYI